MGLLRSDIQNEINKAHIKIDELTTLIAKRYNRSHKYKSLAADVFKAINYIKILQRDENLTDKEVEIFIQALRETLSLHEIAYQPTTLSFSYNQPAITIENLLEVSGTPSYIPRYNSSGTAFEDSRLIQSGNILTHGGTSFILGSALAGGTTRLIETAGGAGLDLTIKTANNLTLTANTIISANPLQFNDTIKFLNDAITIEEIKNDSTFATPSASALVTEEAIDTRIDTEVTTLNSAITAATRAAGSGLTNNSGTFILGGALTSNAISAIGDDIEFKLNSANANFEIKAGASAYFKLEGPTGRIESAAAYFRIGGGVLKYDIDRSGSYDVRSVTDKEYQDTTLAGQPTTALLQAPTGATGYSVVWNGSAFTLESVGLGGAVGNAALLGGLLPTQFVRTDSITPAKTTTFSIDLSGSTGNSGRDIINVITSSDNNYARINMTADGVGLINTGVEFYSVDNTDFAYVKGKLFLSTATTGTAPLIVSSTTQVDNLNSQFLNGFSSSQNADNSTVVTRTGTGGIFTTSVAGITDTAIVVNLNADRLDGVEGANYMRLDQGQTISFDNKFSDGKKLILGDPGGLEMYHNGSTYFDIVQGTNLYIRNASLNILARFSDTQAILYNNNNKKLETTSSGVLVTGEVTANNFIDLSDARKKKEVKKVNPVDIELWSYIKPVQYILNDDVDNRVQYGVIAQDLKIKFPSLVIEGEDGTLAVDYRSLAALTLAKLQSVELRLEKLEQKYGRA